MTLSRRGFLKAGMGALLAGLATRSMLPLARGATADQPWEDGLGVVDYDLVKKRTYGPPELGFELDIRSSPESARRLNIAQWFDYWPGKTISDFTVYMDRRWGISGCSVTWTNNLYSSNEQLINFLREGRRLDVMVPTDYAIEALEKQGLIINLNRDWIPNYLNIFGKPPGAQERSHYEGVLPDGGNYRGYAPFYAVNQQPTYPDEWGNGYNNVARLDFRTPTLNGYQYRMNRDTYPNARGTDRFTWDEWNSLVAVPYQWGTTGIGYRSDIFRREDVERMGWEIFELKTYTNPRWTDRQTGLTSEKTFDLTEKTMLLEAPREVFAAAAKAVGWKRQVEEGVTPTGLTANPEPPYLGRYQWSANDGAQEKLRPAFEWLLNAKENIRGFNTLMQGPWLASGTVYADQAWSGDAMYALRPNSNQRFPIDFVVPPQGSTHWTDCMVIHRASTNLWLAHEFINYIQEPRVQAAISSWNLYATPNAWSFQLMDKDPIYSFKGLYPDGALYSWSPTQDARIYADMAVGYAGPSILGRCERLGDLEEARTLEGYWRRLNGQPDFSDLLRAGIQWPTYAAAGAAVASLVGILLLRRSALRNPPARPPSP